MEILTLLTTESRCPRLGNLSPGMRDLQNDMRQSKYPGGETKRDALLEFASS
jgi:hypothetical protein